MWWIKRFQCSLKNTAVLLLSWKNYLFCHSILLFLFFTFQNPLLMNKEGQTGFCTFIKLWSTQLFLKVPYKWIDIDIIKLNWQWKYKTLSWPLFIFTCWNCITMSQQHCIISNRTVYLVGHYTPNLCSRMMVDVSHEADTHLRELTQLIMLIHTPT